MNKKELIADIAAKSKLTQKDVELMLNQLMDTIKCELHRGGKVQLVGFGSFEIRKRSARTGRNPQTKETIVIPETTTPVFRAGKDLKKAVAEK